MLDPWEFSGEPGHIHIGVLAFPLWGAGPVRVYLVASLVWVAGRYGFSPTWISFGVCLCDSTGGGGGGAVRIFSYFLLCFGVTVRLKWWGGAIFKS